jgi:hypothetical protein
MTTDTAATASIQASARELKLPIIRTQSTELAADAERASATYLGFLADLLEAEVDARTERRRQRMINQARFPRLKRLADFDLAAAPTVNPATIATLAAGNYITTGDPVVLLGDYGTGKSHLLIGLGLAACEQEQRVRYTTAAQLATNSPKPPTTANSRDSWPAMDASISSCSTKSATSNSTREAPNSSSRSSPNAKRNHPSLSRRTCHSANGAKSSPTPDSSPRSSTEPPSTPTSSKPAPTPTDSKPAAANPLHPGARRHEHDGVKSA